ncbi:SulP family inorganic anion transporter [Azospirillum doebereinerae]|uniref:SulP family inorganic anion transporter n=1 Tax=Azospirillum doebereinerae TaxID=92933 RepID=UPI001EE616CB|nr:SulP family inorganic anion transporter [Azospirillum doebereinerae]MCG5241724.1 SulP family inorganic anion transporter [Azospirillum doebereinerae]
MTKNKKTPSRGNAILASGMIGLVAGIDNLGNGLAIAALLFSGPLASGLGVGVGVVLLSAAILALLVGLRSTQPNTVALVQETSVAVLASTVAAMAADTPDAPDAVRVATALAILGTSTLVTGALFWLVGRLRLGTLVRFFPYPVVAGFLAGSGWLLVEGGLTMLTGEHAPFANLGSLANPPTLAKLAPAALLAALLVVVLRRNAPPFALPAVLVGAALAFHAALAIVGITPEQARAWEWLPAVSGGGAVSLPLPTEIVAAADWSRVLAATPAILSVAILGLVGLLLNSSGIELASGRDIDANAELRVTGTANLIAGLFGGPSGFVGLGMTLLAGRLGAADRWAGIATAAVIGLGLFFAGWLVANTPVFLTAGLILFLGVELLLEWAVASRKRLPRGDWLIVLAVLVAIAAIGFIEGLALGLTVSLAMFVYTYARLPVIRSSTTGHALRSRVDRSPAAMHHLTEAGGAIEILQLQGYLFFGTAEQIVHHVRRRLSDAGAPPLRFLIVDFAHIKGMDSAAASGFTRIRNLTTTAGVRLLLSGLPPKVAAALALTELDLESDPALARVIDIDHALEHCENGLLATAPLPPPDGALIRHLEEALGPHARLADAVAALDELRLMPETVLIQAGETASDVFIIGRGRVKVQTTRPDGQRLRLRTMTGGAVVGEIALLLGQRRIADVVVDEPSVIYRLTAATLARLEREDAELAFVFHRLLSTTLAEKLTRATLVIEQAHR